MNFDQARLESTRKCKYDLKRKKINYALKFLEEYEKDSNSNETKTVMQQYLFAVRGIICHDVIDCSQVSKENIENALIDICSNSNKNFIRFYESYKLKISNKYQQEYINNALEDLEVAYKLYCMANGIKINNSITIKELESLYSRLIKEQENNVENIKELI